VRYSNASVEQAKANARAHYGLPQAFYAMWLDEPLMMYTCGYWPEGTRTLEQAQRRKIDHVCAKIRLARGERFIDIGCGFGGFMFRAAENIGATGLGINTTPEQVQWLAGEIQRRGLQGRLEVREADFRAVPQDGPFDKVVSIGVLEHAGRDQLAEVVRAHAACLKPGGLGMLHFIGHVGHYETELFIRKHVFPGGWIPALADVIVEMERAGLEVVDIENLRRHYALTLDEWAARFMRSWPRIQALDPERFTERFRRIWLTYLIGCAEMFRSSAGYTHLFQIVFSKGNVTRDNYPMGRGFLYPL
jgi:cyclopropane-fatty-acyl-phospholipid synthase